MEHFYILLYGNDQKICVMPTKSLIYFLACLPKILKKAPIKGDYIDNIRETINSARWCNKINNLFRCSILIQ